MTVPSETSKTSYTGNGSTTVFPTVFVFQNQSELVVKVTPDGGTETTKVLGTHYTVTGGGNPSAAGAVTFLVAPAADSLVVVERTVPLTQSTAFTTQGAFDPKIHEKSFDELMFVCQQLSRRIADLEAFGTSGDFTAGDGLQVSGSVVSVKAGAHITVSAAGVAADFDLATDTDDGLMSAEDKALLDDLVASASPPTTTLKTTNATETLATEIEIANDSAEVIEITVTASKKTDANAAGYTYLVTAKCFSDTATIIGCDLLTSHESLDEWNVRIAADEDALQVYVTGGAYVVDWTVYARRRGAFS